MLSISLVGCDVARDPQVIFSLIYIRTCVVEVEFKSYFALITNKLTLASGSNHGYLLNLLKFACLSHDYMIQECNELAR